MEPRISNLVLEAVEALGRCVSRDDALPVVAAFLDDFGFSAIVFSSLSRLPGGEPTILLNGWPPGWTERYEEAGHHKSDPVAKHCLEARDVFSWSELPADRTSSPRAMLVAAEAATFGLKEGLCVPMPTSLGPGGMSLAGYEIDDSPAVRSAVRMLAYHLGHLSEHSAPLPSRILSTREVDVLSWIAVGKTVQDIASILDISEHTVAEHLKRIRKKLGTNNAAHSVVKALQSGVLSL